MRKVFTLLAAITLGLASCMNPEKLKDSKDANLKLTKANEYFDKKSYYRASELYGSLIPVVKNTPNHEELLYRYAYCFYNMKDYLSASYQFKSFVDNFPTSPRAEECEFMYAKALYLDAPKVNLDQTSTAKSIAALQTFVSLHKDSKYIQEANKFLDESVDKIERKDADAAKLYYDMKQYKAATVSYNALLQEYPNSQKADYYLYMLISAHYNYAKLSVTEKQEERYADVLVNFNQMKTLFPQSTYLKSAEGLNASAQNFINKLRNEHK